YRIIDFCLSNCVNSGITTIYVLAQYNPRSLIEHIGMGKPWDLDRKTGGIYIMQPSHHGRVAEWYGGTAEALFQNIEIIGDSDADLVLVLSGDQVYRIDYRSMVKEFSKSSSPVTVACREALPGHEQRLGMVDIDDAGMIRDLLEKPEVSSYRHASLGIYLFDREFLLDSLNRDTVDIVFDLLKPAIRRGEVSSFMFRDYWEDIGSIDTYYRASMKLLDGTGFITEKGYPLFTRESGFPPTRISGGSDIRGSIIADGCSIYGNVKESIIFTGVTVERGAEVSKSIIFQSTSIREGAGVYRSIIDKEVQIGEGGSVGKPVKGGGTGITLVGKRVSIAPSASVKPGSMIEPKTPFERGI
ncbi:MAG: glucose-1-phosphate adenylyltransferase, partial [Candidatus Latescibacteria bacterium]|nr:glucose-1-phosphate adenylyltransferase [bacterium]MBD3423561.1 glucose-1-phosphate adenylyltransferase [Candidatus Latescibacterota bacterium]